MTFRVECYAGYRGKQEPMAFWLGGRRLEGRAIVDCWAGPGQRGFRADGGDGHLDALRHDEMKGEWELATSTGGAA